MRCGLGGIRLITCEHALAMIFREVSGEGDGESLDGRDPEVVISAVRKRLGLRARAKEQARGRAKATVRGSGLKQHRPIRAVSKKRAAKQRARRDAVIAGPGERTAEVGAESPEFRLFVSRLACCVDLKPPPPTGVDPCHLRTKRNNGDWVPGVAGEPVGNIFPAVRRYHQEQHKIGIKSFAEKHEINLAEICRVVGEGYLLGLEPDELSMLAISAGGYEMVNFDA